MNSRENPQREILISGKYYDLHEVLEIDKKIKSLMQKISDSSSKSTLMLYILALTASPTIFKSLFERIHNLDLVTIKLLSTFYSLDNDIGLLNSDRTISLLAQAILQNRLRKYNENYYYEPIDLKNDKNLIRPKQSKSNYCKLFKPVLAAGAFVTGCILAPEITLTGAAIAAAIPLLKKSCQR